MFRVFITGRGCTMPYWYRDICICRKKFPLHLLWGRGLGWVHLLTEVKSLFPLRSLHFEKIRRRVLTLFMFSGNTKSKHEISGNSAAAVKLLDLNEPSKCVFSRPTQMIDLKKCLYGTLARWWYTLSYYQQGWKCCIHIYMYVCMFSLVSPLISKSVSVSRCAAIWIINWIPRFFMPI